MKMRLVVFCCIATITFNYHFMDEEWKQFKKVIVCSRQKVWHESRKNIEKRGTIVYNYFISEARESGKFNN